MENPILALYSVASINMMDLRDTIAVLKQCERKLRGRIVMTCSRDRSRSVVKSGAGSIEVALAADPRRWNVHAHVVLDASGLDVAEVQRQWRELVRDCVVGDVSQETAVHRADRRTGTFDVQLEIHDEQALSAYIAKPDTWCPEPGDMPVLKLQILIAATKGKRLAIEWGFRRKK